MRQRGDIAIFTSLIMVTIMLSGAIALGIILSQQIPATLELQFSERAFYAASSATELAFFEIIHNGATGVRFDRDMHFIPYEDEDGAEYYGEIVPDGNGRPCGVMNGVSRGVRRRLARGTPETDCPDTLTVGD